MYIPDTEWAEKREHERIRAASRVRLHVEAAGGRLLTRHGELIDVSEGGCGLRCYKPVPGQTSGVLEMELAGTSISMGVEIRWVRADAYTWKVGCRFTEHGVGEVMVRRMLQQRRQRRARAWTPA